MIIEEYKLSVLTNQEIDALSKKYFSVSFEMDYISMFQGRAFKFCVVPWKQKIEFNMFNVLVEVHSSLEFLMVIY